MVILSQLCVFLFFFIHSFLRRWKKISSITIFTVKGRLECSSCAWIRLSSYKLAINYEIHTYQFQLFEMHSIELISFYYQWCMSEETKREKLTIKLHCANCVKLFHSDYNLFISKLKLFEVFNYAFVYDQQIWNTRQSLSIVRFSIFGLRFA